MYRPAAPAPRQTYAAPRLPPPPQRQPLLAVPPQASAPNPNDGLCFKCGLPGHRSRNCPQNQNHLALPSTGRNNQPHNNNARQYGRGQDNHVDLNEAQDQPATVMGTLLVNSVPASVLFDSGASHSFMSEKFAYAHDIRCEPMNTPIVVRTPVGQCQTTMIGRDVPVEIEGLEFHVSPIILESSNIDLILGM